MALAFCTATSIMEQLQHQHHVEDVGRILLQTQDQLRQLREQLAAQSSASSGPVLGGSALLNNNAGAEIDEILQRAEDELRMKAELVLGNFVTTGSAENPLYEHSLPLVRQPHGLSPGSGGRRRRRRAPHEPNGRENNVSELDLEYFRQRFKPNTVSSLLSTNSPVGPVQRGGGLSVAHRNGKLITHKTTTHARLLPYIHKSDPAAPRPVLSPVDAKQGVLSLINRGFLPPNVDLTPAFQAANHSSDSTDGGGSGVIQNNAVRLYRRDEQPVRAVPYSNPTNFNLATLKFDMSPSNVAISNATDISPHLSPTRPQLNTVTLSLRGEQSPSHEPIKRTIELPSDVGEPQQHHAGSTDPSPTVDTDGDAIETDEANSMDDLRENVEKIRGYNELLDTYSLHQFIIHKGRALRETPEFQSFKRIGQEIWGAIEEVIKALEILLARYFVPLAYVDGQRLMIVAAMEMASFPTHVLLSCVVNEDQVASLLRRPGQRYKGKDRKRRAATTLQAFFRMLLHRNRYRRVCRRGASAISIQKTWRAYAAQQHLRRELTARRTLELKAWETQMAQLRTRWRELSTQRHVVVHVPSLSLDEHARLSLNHFAVQQNVQLARLAAVVDPNVDVIYVAPFELPPELVQYVTKLLQLGGVTNAASRVKILVPEHAATLPAHFSLATMLLYSPHCLCRIRRLVRGKNAYLVMGVPGDEDQRLALALQLPLLGGTATRALVTRSGAKRFFIKADVNVPIGTYDLYDVDEVLFALAKLIISHLDQNVWLLRLDASDIRGTGTVIVDVSMLATVQEIRRERKPPEYWKQPGIRDTVARALLQELERDVATLARPCHPERFGDWAAFVAAMARDGVIIEARPSTVRGLVRTNVFVAPSGDVTVLSTQEALLPRIPNRAPLAFAFPQTLVPHEAVVGAAHAVARVLKEEYAFCGYVSIDLQLGRDDHTATERLWAVALHPYLTDSAATFATFHTLHGGSLDATTGLYHAPTPRCYVSVDFVVHPNLCTMPTASFFHTCRRHGVCFDVERRIGSVFQLPDSLTAGVVGVWSSGESPAQAVAFLRTAFEVLGREVGTQTVGDVDGNFAEILAVLRQRVDMEKDRVKEREIQRPPPVVASVSSLDIETKAPTPTLRVGKVDQVRRMRRGSQ